MVKGVFCFGFADRLSAILALGAFATTAVGHQLFALHDISGGEGYERNSLLGQTYHPAASQAKKVGVIPRAPFLFRGVSAVSPRAIRSHYLVDDPLLFEQAQGPV